MVSVEKHLFQLTDPLEKKTLYIKDSVLIGCFLVHVRKLNEKMLRP
jgi:hypothetical protein